jgi:hypothetical protein
VPLALGATLALAALAYVLLPVLGAASPTGRARTGSAAGGGSVGAPPEAGTTAVDTLREIEFDRETGKLSDADYLALKKTYTERALDELRTADTGPPAGVTPSAVSARVAVLACPACGPRAESDALYCSTCARYLPGSCAACGATVAEPGARYCGACGQRLAA